VYRASTDVVTVDVSVRLRKAAVLGLTATDFEVVDNGVTQSVEVFPVDVFPIDISVVFDLTLTETSFGRYRLASLRDIAAALRSTDRLRVIAHARNVREVVPMRVPTEADRENALDVAMSAAKATLRPEGRDRNVYAVSLFDALLLALARPVDLGRRHLIVVFCGDETASTLADANLLERVVARSDALVHIACWTGDSTGFLPTDTLRQQYARSVLSSAALTSGGERHDLAGGAASTFRSIVDAFRKSYVLQYTLQGVPPGGWHEITVRVPKHPDYTVRARKGYVGR
jgi:VWFA-related protein